MQTGYTFIQIVVFFCILAVSGCSPTLNHKVETSIVNPQRIVRKVSILGTPHKDLQNFRVRLSNYIQLPSQDPYMDFSSQSDRTQFWGKFRSAEQMPRDFLKSTPGTSRFARNFVHIERQDYILFQSVRYMEEIADITDPDTGHKALDNVISMLIETFCLVVQEQFSEDYNVRELIQYTQQTIPPLAHRLYDHLWRIRREKRSGVLKTTEEEEWRRVVSEEGAKLGIGIKQTDLPKGDRKFNSDALVDFANRKLAELAVPYQKKTPFLTIKKLKQDAVFLSAQDYIRRKHGSVHAYFARFEKLLPLIFGSFMMGQISKLPVYPHFDMNYSVKFDGPIVRTNGTMSDIRNVSWHFTEKEMGLIGYRMEAVGLEPATDVLFRLHITVDNKTFAPLPEIYQTISGLPDNLRKQVDTALKSCASQGTIKPLATCIASLSGTASPPQEKQLANLLQLLQSRNPGKEAISSSGKKAGSP